MTETKNIYIFDLDGTLSDTSHRVSILSSNDPDKWDRFYAASIDDPPKQNIVDIFNLLILNHHDVRIFTGRVNTVRASTMEWLNKYTEFRDNTKLLMRRKNNHTKDYLLKKHWLYKYMTDDERSRIKLVFEDRKCVADMYRAEGFTCALIDDGNF